MTKVEELRHHLVIELADLGPRPGWNGWHLDLADAEKEVDSLISAAKAQGVADERERIYNVRSMGRSMGRSKGRSKGRSRGR
jgi:hypothetical protein